MNSHPGHFSRVRQSKHYLMSRPCVSCLNNRIFALGIVNSFVYLFFFTLSGLVHTYLACELQTYFRSSLLSLRKATTGNTSAVHRPTRIRLFLKKEIFLSIVEKIRLHVAHSSRFCPPHADATKNGNTIASLTGHALHDVWHHDIVFENSVFVRPHDKQHFQKSPSGECFWKDAFSLTVFTGYV